MKRTIRNSYYAYTLINSLDNTPFYVGKGYGTRMYAHKTEALKPKDQWINPYKCRKILKILKHGGKIIYDYTLCDSEQEAIVEETSLIRKYGLSKDGGLLTNISTAGQIAQPRTKPIDMYLIDGTFIKTFESAADAARELGAGDPGVIRRCIKTYDTLNTYKGYVFCEHGKVFTYKNKKKKVVTATKNGVIKEFEDTTQAAEFLGRSLSCVRQSCKHEWTIKGYKLKYKNTVE